MYFKLKYYSGGNFKESESFIIANKNNDIKDYVKYKVIIYKEGISFPTLKSISPSGKEGVLTYGRFRFYRNLIFFKRS